MMIESEHFLSSRLILHYDGNSRSLSLALFLSVEFE